MLTLIFLPFILMVKLIVLPWKILGKMMRSSWFWGLAFFFGFMSMLGGLITGLAGLIKGLLPIGLVVAGIALILAANKQEPEASKEAFDSFYASRPQQHSSQE
ncbi:MAG: hypothetical protein IKH77_09210 [Clostridia bacterium]|nr:hypothetical protein [Clostridia bacterium]